FLQFDFQTTDGANSAPLLFSEQIEVITTNEANEVTHCLRRIDQLIEEGFYVAGYFSYELTYALFDDKQLAVKNQMPLLWVAAFEKPMSKVTLPSGNFQVSPWKMQVTQKDYQTSFNTVMQAIERG